MCSITFNELWFSKFPLCTYGWMVICASFMLVDTNTCSYEMCCFHLKWKVWNIPFQGTYLLIAYYNKMKTAIKKNNTKSRGEKGISLHIICPCYNRTYNYSKGFATIKFMFYCSLHVKWGSLIHMLLKCTNLHTCNYFAIF